MVMQRRKLRRSGTGGANLNSGLKQFTAVSSPKRSGAKRSSSSKSGNSKK